MGGDELVGGGAFLRRGFALEGDYVGPGDGVAGLARGGRVLWVRDNGIGFDMRFRDRIFEIFQRLHREEDYPGTGVGLAIVRKLVKAHHGEVQVRSAPGQGATFTVLLPAG